MLDIQHPIICAPMGGGPSTPELVAAVSNAGGLGTLAAAYLSGEQILREIARTRALTSQPFAVNLFAGGYDVSRRPDADRAIDLLRPIHQRFGLAAPELPALTSDPFPAQLEAVLEARPAVFSFTFGIPGAADLARLRSRGILILGTATSVREAEMLRQAKVDAIIAQGEEAGAHRGTFTEFTNETLVPTLELVRQIAGISPVIASGGMMDGSDIARALSAGAFAAQLGTAFLTCPECGAAPIYKQALLDAKSDTTVITRAFSGRHARGLRNTFINLTEAAPDAILPYPWQNALTRPMRTAAARAADPEYLSLWAGRGVTRCRAMPAAELVGALVSECRAQRATAR